MPDAPTPGQIITVIKRDPAGREKTRYQGSVLERLPNGLVIQASWTLPTKDLGYTRFEPGDRFIEYYYTDRWFNIFDIASATGQRKGWYCNVTEPAKIQRESIEQIDLLLDVWVNPAGEILILDEDEFAEDTTLSAEQRIEAQRGLQAILSLQEKRQEMFSEREGANQ